MALTHQLNMLQILLGLAQCRTTSGRGGQVSERRVENWIRGEERLGEKDSEKVLEVGESIGHGHQHASWDLLLAKLIFRGLKCLSTVKS